MRRWSCKEQEQETSSVQMSLSILLLKKCQEILVEDLEIYIKTYRVRITEQDIDSKVGFLEEEFINYEPLEPECLFHFAKKLNFKILKCN